eukprot:GHVP01005796.1.p1 GENE.GHVP01005796.1~~GHVP01005796.1.p1  ORF type:complete len:390 (-),score=70.97 GHVP01005796.1:760-1929(-)
MDLKDDTPEKISSFEELDLKEELLRGIYTYGFDKPSAIQAAGILPILQGHDTIGQAQSGTGKTATFAIAALQIIDSSKRYIQCLVLVPTRELAEQIGKVIPRLGEYLNINVRHFVGGTPRRDDISELEKGVHLAIGTPGRIADLIQNSPRFFDKIRLFVLDEADEMLNRGFKDQIRDILMSLPKDIQIALFSATMPPETLDLAEKSLKQPKKILIKNDELTLEGIRQFYVKIDTSGGAHPDELKFGALKDLYSTMAVASAIIYVNSRRKVDILASQMDRLDFTVSRMHGEMQASERRQVMNEFRSGTTRVLITTDLLARGIDVHQVSMVVNYDIPSSVDSYLHRIGRSGRFGRKGLAINFVSQEDEQQVKAIENHYATQIDNIDNLFKN